MNRLPTAALLLALVFAALPAVADPAGSAEPPAVGEVAPDFTLDALGGGPATLSKIADAGPVVLVVLRGYPGYQCPICTKQVADFMAAAEKFKAAGATVVFVYPGPADHLKARAAEFAKGDVFPPHFRLLLDPGYAFTNAYHLRWDAPNETAYPSTFVLDKSRTIRFAKTSHTHGGRASVDETLAALKGK